MWIAVAIHIPRWMKNIVKCPASLLSVIWPGSFIWWSMEWTERHCNLRIKWNVSEDLIMIIFSEKTESDVDFCTDLNDM